MSLTVASFAITAALCYGVYHLLMWHWRRRHLYRMAAKFEGPTALPFIGNIHLLIGNSEHLLSELHDLSNSYSSPSRLWLGPVLIIAIRDPEQIKTICNHPNSLGKAKFFTDTARPWLGTGILTAPVPKWKVHRKLIQPTFHMKILDSFVAIFSAQSKILTEKMEPNLGGIEFEVFDLVSRCTLDMICETGMGVKMRAQMDKNCYYMEAFQKFLVYGCERMFSPWLYPDFIFQHTKIGKDSEKCIKYLHEFTTNVIKLKKMQHLERQNQADIADDENHSRESTSQRKAFLDRLMTLSNDGVSLSDEELREEVDTMIAGGSETSAISVSYAMLMLASHPEIQEKLYRELLDIYGGDDIDVRPVIPEDLPRMKYMERVIKETLRLFPPIPFIVRELADDLRMGNQTLPKGSTIAVGIFTIHRNEKHWPDPLKFDPDRFLPEEIAKRHPNAFMPFSGGPRNCVGYTYAMMTMKTLLGTVLRKFVLKKDNIVPIKDIRLKMEVMLKPADPVKIRIERRTIN